MHITPCNQVTSILNVCCLNIRGFKSNSDYLRTLLMSHDLLAISEHWLHDYDLHLLSSLSENFLCFSSTSPSREDPVWCRPNFLRGQGGVAILFKKSLQNLVKKLDTSLSHRVVGLQLRTLPLPICFLGVYLPSRSGCTDTFRECLDYIDSLINLLGYENEVIILGDINADPGIFGDPNEQGRILRQYLSRWNFTSVHLYLGSSTHSHTYISEAHNSESTIDHILCHSRFLDAFTSAKVLDECPLNTSDHLPISATIQITLAAAPSLMTTSSSTPRVNWSKLSSSEIEERYTSPLETAVNSWSFPLAPGCSSHIDSSISNLIRLMNNTALKGLPLKKYKKHIIPGWSMYLKSAHSESKSAFRHWKSAGKPMAPANPLKEIYKSKKSHFRKLLRQHRHSLKEQYLLNLDLANKDSKKLFREIKRFYAPSTSTSPGTIVYNDVSYSGDTLLEGWANYFETLGTPCHSPLFDSDNLQSVNNRFRDLLDSTQGGDILLTQSDIANAIDTLKREKAPGPDGIETEHLCFSGPAVQLQLCRIFNAMLASCYIPDLLTLGLVTAIPKGADKDLKNPSNYRGISLLSNVGKLFEKLLLEKILHQGVSLSPLQGGFRPGYSSIHTSFIFQEPVQSLRECGKKAFVAFLDVKKAFDTVWHKGLFVKLQEKGIHPRIWHILVHWYSRLSSCFLLKGSRSRIFPISQGVRQGAILSLLLYSVFVDDLLAQLHDCGLGAMVGSVYCPSPMYADDLALIADSPEGLQKLLNIVSHYTSTWRYEINSSKSAVMVFGESTRSRTSGRQSRSFSVCSELSRR